MMQQVSLIARIHAAMRFPKLARNFESDLDLLLAESNASLKAIFAKGLLTISSLIEHSTASATADPAKSVRLWMKLEQPAVRISDHAWTSLHERGKSCSTSRRLLLQSPLADAEIPTLLARSLSASPVPGPLLDRVMQDLHELKDVDYNATLFACALPQPAFLAWAVDETSTSLAPKLRDRELEVPSDLFRKLFGNPAAGICVPGLVQVVGRESLDAVEVMDVYKTHGNILGSLIVVALAERGVTQLPQLAPEISSASKAVAVLQRKLRMLASPEGSKAVKGAGWLSLFGDFFGNSAAPLWPPLGGRGLRVLALDGGGTRALVTTTILRRLCGNSQVHELFDVIVGTSAGGLLAVALGCMKLTIDEAEQVIRQVGEEVFAVGNNASTVQSASRFYFYGERHSSRELRRKLGGIYGDLTMLELSALHDSACKVAAVSTLSSETPVKPFLFRNYLVGSGESRYRGDWRFPSTTAAMATTAAPTFFRPVVVKTSDAVLQFQDGAMLANNPAHVALHEAVKLFPGREISALVSIGTGRAPWERSGNFSTNKASLIHSLTRDLNTLIYSATSTEAVADILGDMLDKNKFFRFQPELARIVELDEARPDVLREIVDNTERYLELHGPRIDAVKKILTPTKFTAKFSKL